MPKFPLSLPSVPSAPDIRRGGLHLGALLLTAGMIAAAPVRGQTVDLAPVADAAIYEPDDDCSNPMLQPVANGVGPGLFIGRTGAMAEFLRRRSLIRFDVASSIPAGATVESVALALTVDKVPSDDGFTTDVLVLSASWNEGPTLAFPPGGDGEAAVPGDVTWCDRERGTAEWATPGGDFGAQVGSVLMIGEGTYVVPSSPELVTTVQSWLDDPSSNHGLLLRGGEGFGSPSAKRLASREASADGPVLTVTYSVAQSRPTDVPVGRGAGVLLILTLAWCGLRWVRSL